MNRRFTSSRIQSGSTRCAVRASRLARESSRTNSSVFIGRLKRRKGIEELAHALGKVLPKHPGGHMRFSSAAMHARAAARVMRQFWNDALKREGSRPRTGRVPRDDALRVVVRAKLVVLPSRWENFANTALEALALDRPVIATRTGGFVEFIEHDRNGWLVPPGDAEALAAELDRRLGDWDGLLRIGKAAGAHAAEFDAPMIATRLVALYEELLSTQPCGSSAQASTGAVTAGTSTRRRRRILFADTTPTSARLFSESSIRRRRCGSSMSAEAMGGSRATACRATRGRPL